MDVSFVAEIGRITKAKGPDVSPGPNVLLKLKKKSTPGVPLGPQPSSALPSNRPRRL
jgi:hypothetical protein